MAKQPSKSETGSSALAPVAGVRTGLTVAELKQAFLDNLGCGLGRVTTVATRNDAYTALALTVRDRVLQKGVRTLATFGAQNVRMVAYLSAEFLPGPHLATVGSHCVNGVAQLHSELLVETVMRDFAELWPEKFLNVARMGKFSSDRSIRDYCEQVWRVKPVPVAR